MEDLGWKIWGGVSFLISLIVFTFILELNAFLVVLIWFTMFIGGLGVVAGIQSIGEKKHLYEPRDIEDENCLDSETSEKIKNAIFTFEFSPKTVDLLLKNLNSSSNNFVILLSNHIKEIETSAVKNTKLIECLKQIKDIAKSKQQEKKQLLDREKALCDRMKLKNRQIDAANVFIWRKPYRELKLLHAELKSIKETLWEMNQIPSSLVDKTIMYFVGNTSEGYMEIEKTQWAKKIYSACQKKHLTKIKTTEEKELYKLICENLNVPKRYQTYNLLQLGKSLNDAKERPTYWKKDRERYEAEKSNALIVGRSKYLSKIHQRLKEIASQQKVLDTANDLAKLQSKTRAVKLNEYTWGGVANGLAGGAAGLATASDIRNQNAKAEQNAAETRARGIQSMLEIAEFSASLGTEGTKLQNIIKNFADKICDIDKSATYFEHLKCQVTKHSMTKGGALNLTVEINLAKDSKVNGLPVIIDGSLLIEVLESDKKIGEAYLCAPGFDVIDMNKVGFNCKTVYTTTAIPLTANFTADGNYTFVIKPNKIWIIEK